MKKNTLLYLFILFLPFKINALDIDSQLDINNKYIHYNLQDTILNPRQEIFLLSKFEDELYLNFFLNSKFNEKLDLKLKIRPVYYKDKHEKIYISIIK